MVRPFSALEPDITLMDLDLAEGGGVKAIQQIRSIFASARIIGMLTYDWDKSGEDAKRAGACGCLTKDCLNQALVPLIRRCLE